MPCGPELPGHDIEQLLLGLGELYDAVLDPAGWAAATERFGRLFGGSAVLFAQDSRSPASSVFSDAGFDPDFVETYATRYAALNTWTPALARAPAASVVTSAEIGERESFERSEWYNDWLRPQGLCHGTAAILANDGGVLTEFSVIRPRRQGEMPPDKLALLRLLVPHFQRAIRVHRELRRKDAGINAAMQALACLDSAAFVTDERSRVVFLNSIAEELVRSARSLARQGSGPDRAATTACLVRHASGRHGLAAARGRPPADRAGEPVPHRDGGIGIAERRCACSRSAQGSGQRPARGQAPHRADAARRGEGRGDGGRRRERRARARRGGCRDRDGQRHGCRDAERGRDAGQGDLAGIARARALSRATMRNIRQNLVFAFLYNALGIPVAGTAVAGMRLAG